MAKAAVLVAVLLGAVAASALLTEGEYQRHFTTFFKTYNKRYSTEEFFHRFEIFKDNLDYILEENGKNHTYWLDVNEFSDLTHHEFVSTYLGRLPSSSAARDTYVHSNRVANNIDWREKGAVTPVKNQGQCGSCWAFSATGAIEGYHFLHTGQLVGLSEQQIVDCCHDSSKGCSGGFESAAINWVAKNRGNAQCAEKDYPYTAREGSCKRCQPVATVNGVKEITGAAALTASLNNLPTTVAVDASARAWQSYRGGVFDTTCGRQLNHAILAVGYDDQAYIVKNSWGASWGDKGYIHMVRNKNMCGVEAEPSYPI